MFLSIPCFSLVVLPAAPGQGRRAGGGGGVYLGGPAASDAQGPRGGGFSGLLRAPHRALGPLPMQETCPPAPSPTPPLAPLPGDVDCGCQSSVNCAQVWRLSLASDSPEVSHASALHPPPQQMVGVLPRRPILTGSSERGGECPTSALSGKSKPCLTGWAPKCSLMLLT